MKSILKPITALISTAFTALIAVSPMALAKNNDAEITWQKINNGALIIDVRTADEFAQGHLPNAVNIPYETIGAQFSQRNIAKEQPVVVYCRSGRRSAVAQENLLKLGYKNVHNGGGYQQLNDYHK